MICMSLVIDRIQETLPFPEGALIMSPALERNIEQDTEDRLYTHVNRNRENCNYVKNINHIRTSNIKRLKQNI